MCAEPHNPFRKLAVGRPGDRAGRPRPSPLAHGALTPEDTPRSVPARATPIWLVLDWIINREDVAFHAVLALVMAGLVTLGAGIARAARRLASTTRPNAMTGQRS